MYSYICCEELQKLVTIEKYSMRMKNSRNLKHYVVSFVVHFAILQTTN